jgi:hypothetical protein
MQLSTLVFRLAGIPCALLIFSAAAGAADRKSEPVSNGPQDKIEVVGHIPLNGDPVEGLISTQHYSDHYLYVERQSGNTATLIDVTGVARPVILADVPYAPPGDPGKLLAAAGTSALVTDDRPSPVLKPRTVRIMDFSNPASPKVVREFAGITALSGDPSRGLVFLANPDGIWILHQSFALDPELEAAYAREIRNP